MTKAKKIFPIVTFTFGLALAVPAWAGTAVPTGLSSLPNAVTVNDTDTFPICQNGVSSCSTTSYTWSNISLSQVDAYLGSRSMTFTGKTISGINNTLTNIPAANLNGIIPAINLPAITSSMMAVGAAVGNLGFTPLNPANNLSEVVSAATARTNLGLGSLATLSALPSTSLTGTLQAAQFPAITGDVAISAGTLTATLATVNGASGATTCSNITTNGKGLVTSNTNGACGSSYTAGTGLQLVGAQFSIPSAGITSSLLASGVAVANLGFTPLNKASNLSDLVSASTARTNLGLGSLAILSALPTPQAAVLGGAFSLTGTAHQFLTGLNTSGAFTAAQPDFTDLTGSPSDAQLTTPLTTPPVFGKTTPNEVDASLLLTGTTSASSNYIANAITGTTSISQIVGLTNAGFGFGVLGGCQTSGGANNTDCFGTGGFVLLNGATTGNTVYGLFGQSRHIVAQGVSQAIELNPINISGTQPSASYPYAIIGDTTTHPFVISNWSSCGDPSNLPIGTHVQDCSIAYGIVNNANSGDRATGGSFLKGIVFQSLAIRGTTGIDTDTTPVDAISLARMQGISFYNSGDTTSPAHRIYEATTSTTPSGMNLRFDSSGVVLEGSDLSWQFVVHPLAAATDYVFVNGGTSTSAAGIGVTSGRSTASLLFSVSSSGVYSFYSGATLDGYFGTGGLTIPIAGGLSLTPATWTDVQTCTAGQVSVDASFIYVCTATNTVKRVALSTF